LQDKTCDLVYAYNSSVDNSQNRRDKFDAEIIKPLKYFGFLMRAWLQKYLNLIWAEENINISNWR
jgi:hypothetical protein